MIELAKKTRIRVGDCIFYMTDFQSVVGKRNANMITRLMPWQDALKFEGSQICGVHPGFPNIAFGIDIDTLPATFNLRQNVKIYRCEPDVNLFQKLKKPIRIQHGALNLLAYLMQYIANSPVEMGGKGGSKVYDRLGRKILRIQIPPMFKKVEKPTLYRGLNLSDKAVAKLEQGKPIKLKRRKVTSWSTSKYQASGFGGMIIRIPSNKAPVLVNVDTVFRFFHFENASYEKEVLCVGTGLSKDIVYPNQVGYK